MNQELGAQCPHCRCALQATEEFGADMKRCPLCRSLLMSSRGIARLITRLRTSRERGWQELSWSDFAGQLHSCPQTER